MLDHFGPTPSPGMARNVDDFPIAWHPHRGMDILTYMLQGCIFFDNLWLDHPDPSRFQALEGMATLSGIAKSSRRQGVNGFRSDLESNTLRAVEPLLENQFLASKFGSMFLRHVKWMILAMELTAKKVQISPSISLSQVL